MLFTPGVRRCAKDSWVWLARLQNRFHCAVWRQQINAAIALAFLCRHRTPWAFRRRPSVWPHLPRRRCRSSRRWRVGRGSPIGSGGLRNSSSSDQRLAASGPTTPTRATARARRNRQGAPQAGSCQTANDEGGKSGMGVPRSIETRNKTHACMAFRWNETKKNTVLRIRMGRDHGRGRCLVALA